MTIPTRRNRIIAERDAESAAITAEIAAQQALKDAACEDAYTAKVAVDTAVTAVATAITDEATNQTALDALDATVASTLSDMNDAQDAYDALGVDADRATELATLTAAIAVYKAAVVAQSWIGFNANWSENSLSAGSKSIQRSPGSRRSIVGQVIRNLIKKL